MNPENTLTLPETEIHVWTASCNADDGRSPRLWQLLSENERERAQRFIFERHGNAFVFQRGTLREILGQYLNKAPEQIVFTYSAFGKPQLAGSDNGAALSFNVAHSHGLAVFAITRGRPVGIDVEYLNASPEIEKIARRFFSPGEYEALCAKKGQEKRELFFRYWTCKEAYVKALGTGLQDLQTTDFNALSEKDRFLFSDLHNDRWSMHTLRIKDEYIAALAVPATAVAEQLRLMNSGNRSPELRPAHCHEKCS